MADFLNRNVKYMLKGDQDAHNLSSGTDIVKAYIGNNPEIKICDIIPMSIVRSVSIIDYPFENVIKEVYPAFGSYNDIFERKTFVFHGRVSLINNLVS